MAYFDLLGVYHDNFRLIMALNIDPVRLGSQSPKSNPSSPVIFPHHRHRWSTSLDTLAGRGAAPEPRIGLTLGPEQWRPMGSPKSGTKETTRVHLSGKQNQNIRLAKKYQGLKDDCQRECREIQLPMAVSLVENHARHEQGIECDQSAAALPPPS